jgi:TonB family protein
MRSLSINKDKSALLRKTGISLLSLAVHAVFIYLIFTAKITVKIHTYRYEMRDVIIASPGKLFIPENAGRFREATSESEPGREPGLRRTEAEPRIESKAAADNLSSEAGPGQRLEGTSGREIKDETSGKALPAEQLSGFRLDLSSRSNQGAPPAFDLDLFLTSRKIKNISEKKERGSGKKETDLRKYLYSGSSNIFPSQIAGTSVRGRSGSAVQRASASFPYQGYDITPWATKVVNKILLNWAIPGAQQTEARGTVGISTVIEKSGEVSSIKFVNSSLDQILDEAALRAVRMSSPFPGLPDDFPKKNIEVYFEFHYND